MNFILHASAPALCLITILAAIAARFIGAWINVYHRPCDLTEEDRKLGPLMFRPWFEPVLFLSITAVLSIAMECSATDMEQKLQEQVINAENIRYKNSSLYLTDTKGRISQINIRGLTKNDNGIKDGTVTVTVNPSLYPYITISENKEKK